MGFVNTARVLLLVGFSLALVACSGSAAESDDRARQEQIRRDAPGVFDEGTASDRDRARVFTDPGEPDEVPMTRTLSIDGSDPRLSPGRDPIAPEQRPRPSAGASTEGNPSGWAVLLERVGGEDHANRAQARAAQLARALGRSDVRVRAVSSGSAVVLGGYSDPQDEQAQEDLQYVKSLTVQGTRPYAMAMLVPPLVQDGTNLRHSLIEAAKQLEDVYTHTLQIAVFAGDEQTRRADAERYCAQLRNQGHEAFYFHGRRVSSVTVGTFTAQDYDMRTGVVSPRLDRLREEFPHNLYNGEIQRDPQTRDIWNSALVEIPRSN